MTTDRFITRGDNGQESHFFYATASPTIINVGKPLIVYSQHKIGEPAVYFYDVFSKKDVCKVSGAEIFLMSASFSHDFTDDILLFKADPVVCHDKKYGRETLSERAKQLGNEATSSS